MYKMILKVKKLTNIVLKNNTKNVKKGQKMKIRQEVLTLKCNRSSLTIFGALWDNYAYFLPTYWSAVTFKRSYSNANQQ